MLLFPKRLSFVAQDKNPGPDARAAFEALNKAHRELKDPGSRVSRSVLLCNVQTYIHLYDT